MDVLCVCPSQVVTGGTESIHNFTKELSEHVDAQIWYMGAGLHRPQPDEYDGYGVRYVTEFPQGFRGLIIFPEIWANMALDPKYKDCIRAVNWLGIDAYAGHTPRAKTGAVFNDDSILHLAQSEYAHDFLQKLGVKKIYRNVDVLNTDFFEDYTETERSNVVLYNPAKATDFTQRLMNACSGVTFRPIKGLSRSQVIKLMRKSKLYIDFGNFPGRERIPREAVMCGCCIIIGAVGSGRFYEDFTIPSRYIYERNDAHIFAIVRAIHNVLNNYEECRRDFDMFRKIIEEDRGVLKYQCKEIAYDVFINRTGS